MDLHRLAQLAILFIAQGTLGEAWTPRLAKYEGYDLERGPVLYEAYYPDEQGTNENVESGYQEKRFFDFSDVPERSYQLSEDGPYELPYRQDVRANQEDHRMREYDQAMSGYYPMFAMDRPQGLQDDGHSILEQRFDGNYAIAGRSPGSKRDLPPKDYVLRGRPSSYGFQTQDENAYNLERDPERRNDPPSNIIVFGEPPEPAANRRDHFEPWRLGENPNPGFNPGMKMRSSPPEDIFQPRPQVINYVFSSRKKVDDARPPVLVDEETESNEWPRNYGDNIINEEIRKEGELKKDEAKIASIEVSEVSHHKTRHHHGERPRRNFAGHY